MANCKDSNRRLEYARAYIVSQRFENLYSADEALRRGTIFRDLYRPYEEESEEKTNKRRR